MGSDESGSAGQQHALSLVTHLGAPSAFVLRSEEHLNSSHSQISYAVFCLKKKKKKRINPPITRTTTTGILNQTITCLYTSRLTSLTSVASLIHTRSLGTIRRPVSS